MSAEEVIHELTTKYGLSKKQADLVRQALRSSRLSRARLVDLVMEMISNENLIAPALLDKSYDDAKSEMVEDLTSKHSQRATSMPLIGGIYYGIVSSFNLMMFKTRLQSRMEGALRARAEKEATIALKDEKNTQASWDEQRQGLEQAARNNKKKALEPVAEKKATGFKMFH